MRHRITLSGKDQRLWLARDAQGYRLELDEGSFRVALTTVEGPPSFPDQVRDKLFDKLRMRATEDAVPKVESLILSLSKDEAFGPAKHLRLTVDGLSEQVVIAVDGDDIHVHIAGAAHHLRYLDPVRALGEDEAADGHDIVRAPMPGTVVAVHVGPGQTVAAGEALLVIESMKLETTIRARHDGEIGAVHVAEGASFERDAALVTFAGGAA